MIIFFTESVTMESAIWPAFWYGDIYIPSSEKINN